MKEWVTVTLITVGIVILALALEAGMIWWLWKFFQLG